MENLIKLEIFEKNEDFEEKMLNFKKKKYFFRNNKINLLLDNFSEIVSSDVFGWIYDKYKNPKASISIEDITHTIEDIFVENNKYYAYIKFLGSKGGERYKQIDPNELYLHPLYNNQELWTLCISIKQSVLIKRILDRK